MSRFKNLGVAFNRLFRNDLNENFTKVDSELTTQKARVDNLIANAPQPSEVVDARGTAPLLGDRLDGVDVQLAQNEQDLRGRGRNLKEFGATYDGVTDDSQAIANAHSQMAAGEVLLITGPTRLKNPVVWTKKADIICVGDKGYFISDVGTSQDAITIKGMALNYSNIRINLYGLANSCRNGLVMDAVNLSKIKARIKTGATQYGFVTKGCLLSEHDIHISSNYSAPLAGAVMPANMILFDTGTALISESNATVFYLMLEGGNGDGVTKLNSSLLETVEFKGTIEGIGGRPFNINKAQYININNMHLELNDMDSVFTDVKNIEVGSGVRNNTMKMKFVNCLGLTVDGYSGSLEFDATCTGEVRQVSLESVDSIVNNSKGGVFVEGTVVDFTNASRNAVLGIGKNVPENLFHNPFVDIWTNGNNAAPDGWSGSTITWAKETVNYFKENPSKIAIYCQQTGTTVADGARATLKPRMNSSRWVAITLPVYVPAGQPDVRIFVYDVDQFRLLKTITEKDKWVLVCGASEVNADKPIAVQISPHNGSAYVAGNYYIGGLTVTNGNVGSRYLLDNGKRSEHLATSVSNPPAFVGQRALVSGVFYMAKGIASSTDWVALN